MKKIIIVMISCLFIFVLLMLINNMLQQTKINKGIKEFGTEYCQGHIRSHLEFVGQAFTSWKCEICGYIWR